MFVHVCVRSQGREKRVSVESGNGSNGGSCLWTFGEVVLEVDSVQLQIANVPVATVSG